MTLEQVVGLLISELTEGHFTGENALRRAEVFRIARETWIEHQALPEMPVLVIIQRHLYHTTYVGEELFWHTHGLDPETFMHDNAAKET